MCSLGEVVFVEEIGQYGRYIDKCLVDEILKMRNEYGINTVACCCGHGRYPPTFVCDVEGSIIEYYTEIQIPRIRRFYRKDKDGYYYIPEIPALQTATPSHSQTDKVGESNLAKSDCRSRKDEAVGDVSQDAEAKVGIYEKEWLQ